SPARVASDNGDQLDDAERLAREIRATTGRDTNVYLQYFYGPQVALPFIKLASLPFLTQAEIWVALSLLMYFVCIYLIWKRCAALRSYRALVAICALAYPPLFHFFVRGQLSAVVLVCFTAAYLAFCVRRVFLAGLALGLVALM